MAGKSEEEIRAAAERVKQQLDFYEAEAKARGERFERLDEETLLRKLAGDEANTPFISGAAWSSSVPPGGTANFRVFIQNPDAWSYSGNFLYGYLFFGPANLVQSTDLSLTAVDTRFPRYLHRLGVPAGGSADTTFTIVVPAGLAPGVYVANCYLVMFAWYGSGGLADRVAFDMTVL
ncbi:hypothetical protein ACVGVM_10170 [Pseudonocardia bannensis]|uniref:Uncharacterized protein n=1 Tax=Pseudonocardia bannensis TaxID=630973 RepID=A0A848DH78_9PSEU|nr:hypothetical protein [Pseudonocardia bannensis]NMH92032.1 hypothetical protein [Pseudonocardia bannensis]